MKRLSLLEADEVVRGDGILRAGRYVVNRLPQDAVVWWRDYPASYGVAKMDAEVLARRVPDGCHVSLLKVREGTGRVVVTIPVEGVEWEKGL